MAKKKDNSETEVVITDKMEKIRNAMAEMNKKYGVDTIRRMGDKPIENVPVVSSGILSLDIALGGGYPVGRIVEIYGPEAGGKTALATYGAIEIQKSGREAGFIDVENSFNPEPAENNGLDINRLFMCQPDTGEQAFDVMEALALTGEFGCLIFDSVAAAEPKSDTEAEMGAPSMAVQARLMSQCLRRTQPVFAKSRCTAFFINQIREKMVMMGNPETTPGGRALRFYSSIRLEVRPCAYLNDKGAEVKTKEEAAGHRIKVKVVKNKIFPPFKTAEFDFYYGVGVDLETDIVSVAKSLGVIETSGTWLSYGSCKEQGAAKMKAALRDANLFEEIKQKTMELVGFAKCSGE